MDLRERLGFRDGNCGPRSGRSMMYADIEKLLEAAPPDADPEEYRHGGKPGVRVNDHHVSLEEKRRARVQRGE